MHISIEHDDMLISVDFDGHFFDHEDGELFDIDILDICNSNGDSILEDIHDGEICEIERRVIDEWNSDQGEYYNSDIDESGEYYNSDIDESD